ncbi:endopeptidase Clp [Trifolium repens]|nr:endopeptidase Clp [Trifolium repens]
MMPIGTPRVAYRTPGEGTYQWIYGMPLLMKNLVIKYWQLCCISTLKITHKLYLYINGPGGDLTPCIALYDTMQSLQTHIATHFLGQAYNLAAFPWRKDGE